MTDWTVGDLEPPLAGVCTDEGAPVDLSTATAVAAHVRRPDGSVIDRAVDVNDDQAGDGKGAWTMPLQDGDLPVRGMYTTEVQVTWPGGRPQTFASRDAVFEVRDQIA